MSQSLAFHAHGNAHASANAQSGHAALLICVLECVKQRCQNTAAGRTEGMANRNCTSVNIDLQCGVE
jgi:hypothetical protein